MKKKKYPLPYIEDPELFKAVQFSLKMIRDGINPATANYRAAQYYGYDTSAVAHYVGTYANNIKQQKGGRL